MDLDPIGGFEVAVVVSELIRVVLLVAQNFNYWWIAHGQFVCCDHSSQEQRNYSLQRNEVFKVNRKLIISCAI